MKQRKNMRNEAKKEKDDIANHENFPQDKNQKIPIFVAEQREIRGTEIDTRLKSQATDHHQLCLKADQIPITAKPRSQILNHDKPRRSSGHRRNQLSRTQFYHQDRQNRPTQINKSQHKRQSPTRIATKPKLRTHQTRRTKLATITDLPLPKIGL